MALPIHLSHFKTTYSEFLPAFKRISQTHRRSTFRQLSTTSCREGARSGVVAALPSTTLTRIRNPSLIHTTSNTRGSRRESHSHNVQIRSSHHSSLASRLSSMLSLQQSSTIKSLHHKGLNTGQVRHLFGGNTSRNLLAHLEQTANNNPSSATSQNAFYSALMRANMPQIVVERFETGRFASSPACEAVYHRALESVGSTEGAGTGLSAEQIQSIGQAVGARQQGAGVARLGRSSGSKGDSLYVVVEESLGSTIFKWLKFALWFTLAAYFAMVVVTLVVESTGVLKKGGGTQNAEAKPEAQTTRFSDVHGCDEAIEELKELVDFLKAPEKYSALGGKMPKGVLLVGPPGTGKTLLARAVAGEAGVPYFYMSGSEFDEVYVGVGAKRVRELFQAARAKAPAIVFIDELDAIGGKRNDRDAAYVKQTLNQLLTELDGFDQNSGVIFMAATNFPRLLDKALLRPGRFDRNVVVPLPDVRGRVAILKHHMRNIQVGTDVDAAVIARGTPGCSGAELENICNQAAVHASKLKNKKVIMSDFEWATDKILMGAERRSAVIQPKDKLMTAYHEGGHALCALYNENASPLHKATIMPRGEALGITYQLPEMDVVSVSKKQYHAMLDVCMGGQVAEEIVYGKDSITSGASSDLVKATQIAYQMVTKFGMSDALGPVDLDPEYRQISPETKRAVDREVRRILDESRARAMKLLTEKREELEKLAKGLVDYETLNKTEIEKVVKGEQLPDRVGMASVPIRLPPSKPTPVSDIGPTPQGSDDPGTGAPPPPAFARDATRDL